MPAEILATKLFIPPLRAGYVPRPHLIARLHEGANCRLTLISTPAGFGKTTLLCEWIREKNLRAAWLSIDEGDNAIGRFVSHLSAALGIPAEQTSFRIARRSQINALLTGLLNAVAQNEPIFLILNDYHLIHEAVVHEAVNFLLEHCPPQLRVVIATRAIPPLALAKFRAQGQVNELKAQDLRFNRQEVENFLNVSLALGLSDSQVSALNERTEGWAAGLQLAALAMSGRKDINRFVQSFVGSHHYVLDYLTDEVLNRQPDSVQAFLLKTSILEKMSAPLCDQVTGQKNALQILEALEADNMFIVPLDDERKWYRYHHLFSDLLRYRLEKSMPEATHELHRRAAEWCTQNGETYEAIRHALAAKDDALAIRVVEDASPVLAMRGDMNQLLALLNALPKPLARSSVNLMFINAWAHLFMMDIDAVEAYLREATRNMQDETAGMYASKVKGQAGALQAFVAVYRGNPQQAIELAHEALKNLPTEPNIGRYAVYAALGDAYRDVDNFASASQTYAEAVKAFAMMNQQTASLAIRMDLARLRVKMGQLNQALAICEDTIRHGDEIYPLFPVAQALILPGDLLRERNDLDGAEKILRDGINQCKLAGYFRYLVTGYVVLARVHYARNAWGEMESALTEAIQSAREAGVEALIRFAEMNRVRLRNGAGVEIEANQKWAAQFEAENQPANISSEDDYLTLARVLLAHKDKGALKKRLATLDELLEKAEKSERAGSVIEIRIAQALILRALGHATEAAEKLNSALRLGEIQGYARIFIDEGAPMAELLKAASQRGAQREYAGRLLQSMHVAPNQPTSAEALTEREMEILCLLDGGLSNQQISEKLFVSLATVKTHVAHLFDKLGVKSRTQALAAARERGLL